MFESLFVAAVLSAGGPPAPPPRTAAPLPADVEVAFADTNLGVALASPAPANKDELVALARLRYDRVLKQNPTHKGALLGVARMHTKLGDRGNACSAFARYLAAYPDDAAGHHEAALMHARFGDWPVAVGRASTAARLDSASRQYGTTLGFCLARAGRWDDAHTALCRVMPADEARESVNLVREHVAALTRQQVLPRPALGTERFDAAALARQLACEKEQVVVTSCVPAERAGPFVALPPVAPAPRAVSTLTASYHLRNVAAADAAKAIGAAIGSDREFRTDAATNQLVVTGSVATHARVAAWLAELDREVPQVQVSMTIAEVPGRFLADCGLTKSGFCFSLKERERELFAVALRNYPGSSVLSRPELLVRDNQKGYVAVGQDMPVLPVVPPGAVPAPGAVVPVGAVDTRVVGVTVCVTPRIMPDGKVTLRVEPQFCSPAPNPVTVGTAGTAFPFNIQTVQTTVLVSPGETVVLAHEKTGADGKPVSMLIVLTPTVRP